MSEDNEKELLAEVEHLLEEEHRVIHEERDNAQRKHLLAVERRIFEEYKFDDPAHIFFEIMVANSEEEAEELLSTAHLDPDYDPNYVIDDNVPEGEKPAGAGYIRQVAEGDLFGLLGNKLESLETAENEGIVAMFARAPMWASPETGGEKEDGVMLAMICDQGFHIISRLASDPTHIIETSIDPSEYELGDSRFADAMIHFWFFPRWLRERDKALFDATLRDFRRNNEKKGEEE